MTTRITPAILRFRPWRCYGGPGIATCRRRARATTTRPRSHNTPRNHRIDVTDCAKPAPGGADSLQITLVVIGVDYREDRIF